MKKDRRETPALPCGGRGGAGGQAARSAAAEYLTFVAAAGTGGEAFELRYKDENIWLAQKMMAALYGVDTRTTNGHIKTIY